MRPFSSTRGLTSESRVPAKDKQQASYGDADCLLVFFRVVSMPHSNEFTSLAEYAACMRVHVHVHWKLSLYKLLSLVLLCPCKFTGLNISKLCAATGPPDNMVAVALLPTCWPLAGTHGAWWAALLPLPGGTASQRAGACSTSEHSPMTGQKHSQHELVCFRPQNMWHSGCHMLVHKFTTAIHYRNTLHNQHDKRVEAHIPATCLVKRTEQLSSRDDT